MGKLYEMWSEMYEIYGRKKDAVVTRHLCVR